MSHSFYRIQVAAQDGKGEPAWGYLAYGCFSKLVAWHPVVQYHGEYSDTGVVFGNEPLPAPVVLTPHLAVTFAEPQSTEERQRLDAVLAVVRQFAPEARFIKVVSRAVRRGKKTGKIRRLEES